jgi:hypothetical protein
VASAAAEEIGDHRQPVRPLVQLRPAMQQRARVGISRRGEHLLPARPPHLAMPHHHHLIGNLRHQPQIVGNKQHRHGMPLLQPRDQFHDLLLYRDVQRRGRLIGNQQLGLAGDRHRNHHALLLAAGQLARIASILSAGSGMPTSSSNSSVRRRACARLMLHVQHQHFRNLRAHREHRIQRRHRLLENHRDLFAAEGAALLAVQRQQLAAIELDAAIMIAHRASPSPPAS